MYSVHKVFACDIREEKLIPFTPYLNSDGNRAEAFGMVLDHFNIPWMVNVILES